MGWEVCCLVVRNQEGSQGGCRGRWARQLKLKTSPEPWSRAHSSTWLAQFIKGSKATLVLRNRSTASMTRLLAALLYQKFLIEAFEGWSKRACCSHRRNSSCLTQMALFNFVYNFTEFCRLRLQFRKRFMQEDNTQRFFWIIKSYRRLFVFSASLSNCFIFTVRS